jgi:hypothetical protein
MLEGHHGDRQAYEQSSLCPAEPADFDVEIREWAMKEEEDAALQLVRAKEG